VSSAAASDLPCSASPARPFTVLASERHRLTARNAELDSKLVTVDFGGVHQEKRDPIFDRYPLAVQVALKEDYLKTAGPIRHVLFRDERCRALDEGRGTDSYYQADIELRARDRVLTSRYVHVAFDWEELKARALIHSRICGRFRDQMSVGTALSRGIEYVKRCGVKPPVPGQRGVSELGCLNRLGTPRWWTRAMRCTYSRISEEALRACGHVHSRAGLYVSDAALQCHLSQKRRTFDLMSEVIAESDLGDRFSLADLSSRNVSNPWVRRAELMVRIRGLESHAKRMGHEAILFVVTLPSRFHCRHGHSGESNHAFAGLTPREGQEVLKRQWARLRSHLSKKGISIYGIRTAEPHHDGTPHWNVLVFMHPCDRASIRKSFERYFLLNDSPDEPGARERRIKVIDIDERKGGATCYIAKYISKNIDGHRVGADREDVAQLRDASETSVRVEAWASVHGIRQFQLFGGPPVSVWRELRRLKRSSLGVIEAVRQAVDAKDWCAFTETMGQPGRVQGVSWPVRLHRLQCEIPGLYGDPSGPRVVGVESDDLVEVTRDRSWKIEWQRPEPESGRLQ
jgi:hypothetical protein